MKRIFFILAALNLISVAAFPQHSLKFNETVFDFGQILLSDGAVSHTFTAKNVSSSPVTIRSVTTSCGCTDVRWKHDEIMPGGTADISVTYSNDEGPYSFDKTITVNVAGESKPMFLHIRGLSRKAILPDSEVYTSVFCGSIGLTGEEFKVGNLEQGGSRGDQTTVANLSDRPAKITFTSVSDGLSLRLSENPIPPHSKATLYYTVSSRSDKWGSNDYSAVLTVNGVKSEEHISVKAFTAGNFSALTKEEKQAGSRPVFAESTFSFGHKKQGTVLETVFKCENKGKSPLHIYKVDADAEGVTAGAFPDVAPGANGSFPVRLDTKNLPKGEALVILTLTTNSPIRPIVTLFLAGWID